MQIVYTFLPTLCASVLKKMLPNIVDFHKKDFKVDVIFPGEENKTFWFKETCFADVRWEYQRIRKEYPQQSVILIWDIQSKEGVSLQSSKPYCIEKDAVVFTK